MSDPQLVRLFLVPSHRCLGSINLDAEPILATRRDLACCVGAASSFSHSENDCSEILRLDLDFVHVRRCQRLPSEGLDRLLWTLASLMECLQIRTKALDPQTGDVLRHVAPV